MTKPPPAPFVPQGCDLRDFVFMPLDVRRLLTSETWLEAADEPKVGHAAMCLWCEAWHQVPAASLPDNDKVLARLAMCSPDEWARVKGRVLRSWVKCSDGRLYHPVVAEKARESWGRKLAQRQRTQKATEARMKGSRERRNENRDDVRDENRDDARNVHQGTGTGTGTGKKTRRSDPGGSSPVNGFDETANQFDAFWLAYPSRGGHPNPKKPALTKFQAAVKRGVDPAEIVAGAERYAQHVAGAGTKSQFVAQAVTWLTQERWADKIPAQEDRPRAGMI